MKVVYSIVLLKQRPKYALRPPAPVAILPKPYIAGVSAQNGDRESKPCRRRERRCLNRLTNGPDNSLW